MTAAGFKKIKGRFPWEIHIKLCLCLGSVAIQPVATRETSVLLSTARV